MEIDIIEERKDIYKQKLKLERDEKKLRWKEKSPSRKFP